MATPTASTVRPLSAGGPGARPTRRPYQYHNCTLINRLRQLRPDHTASQLAALLGLRSARHVRDLCATYGIRKRRA